MKLKTRLVIAFFTIIIIPVLMAAMMVSMVCRYQIGVVEKNYGITGTTISDFTNSMQVLARVTEKPYHELKKMSEHASEMEDATELDQFNKKLENKNAYLLVRKDGTIVYTGSDDDRVKAVIEQLPGYGDTDTTSENGIYLGGDAEALVKQVDFRYDDGNKGSAFIVSDVSNVIPEVGHPGHSAAAGFCPGCCTCMPLCCSPCTLSAFLTTPSGEMKGSASALPK